MADDVANVEVIKWVALFYKLGASPKDFIPKEKFRITTEFKTNSVLKTNQTTGKHCATIRPHRLKMTWNMPILVRLQATTSWAWTVTFFTTLEREVLWGPKHKNSIQYSSIYTAGSTC